MQKYKALKLIFEDNKILVVERNEVKAFDVYGLCNNASIEANHEFEIYQACQSYDLKCSKNDWSHNIFDTLTRKELPVRPLDYIKEHPIIAIEVIMEAGFGMRIYVPYDKDAICQNVIETADEILIKGSVH